MKEKECCYAVRFSSLKIGEEFASSKPNGKTKSEKKKEYKFIKYQPNIAQVFGINLITSTVRFYTFPKDFPCLIFKSRFNELKLKDSDRANMIEYTCGSVVLNGKRLSDINKCIKQKIEEPTCYHYVNFEDVPMNDEFLIRPWTGNEVKYKKIGTNLAESVGPKNIKSVFNRDCQVLIFNTRINQLRIRHNTKAIRTNKMVINGIKIKGWKRYPNYKSMGTKILENKEKEITPYITRVAEDGENMILTNRKENKIHIRTETYCVDMNKPIFDNLIKQYIRRNG